MNYISRSFIYLLIFNICMVNVQSDEHVKFVNNGDELNEFLHEDLIEKFQQRSKRAIGDSSTLGYDGSGSITVESSTYIATTFVTIQPTVSKIETSEQSTIEITTGQTSLLVPTTFISATSEITTIFTSTSSPICNTSTSIQLPNNTCISKMDLQIYSVDILRNGTGNETLIATALSLYIASTTNANISWNPYYILSPNEIEEYVSSLGNVSLIINSNTSFIMAQPVNTTTLGAAYTHNVGGQIINSSNENSISNLNLTAAAIIHNESLVNASFISMMIVDKPTTYENIDNSSNEILASSVIVVSVQRNSSSSTSSMNISLYFQVLDDYKPNVAAIYSCSFYDLNRLQWNESGCTVPIFNSPFNRYECSCNHLSTFALVWSPNITSCNADTEVSLPNGTCTSKTDAQILSVNTLRSNSTNSTVIADALSLYISSITNANTALDSTYILTINEIDTYLSSINNASLTRNTNQSFLMAEPPNQGDGVIVMGASFTHDTGGLIVKNTNQDNVISTSLSSAATIGSEGLIGVTSLNMLIIDDPSVYRNIDNSTNKILASSIIISSIKRNNSLPFSINISLYFQILDEWKPNTSDVDYYCSFYDTNQLQWNESGCTTPSFNAPFNRYECSCNHLTSFALLWLPNVPLTRNLDAQDIASLVFESISIICFICIIIHATVTRLRRPQKEFLPYELLPLISSASTTILFIFHIALGMTVYTKTSSENETQCFLSSSVLMFFVYFFLIFMFCAKTSVGYFNYLRFIRLFPQPSRQKLFNMLIISFSISITCVAFAAGFNSNSSFKITELYPYKLCWFTRDVLYYFLTIPVCLFILINIILISFVARRIIKHVRNATSPHQSFERMKRCMMVLLASCLTQGIGWLFGPFLTIATPTAGEVLGWFFVVFNGLEGLWTIILYVIIRSQNMDEQKRAGSSIASTMSRSPKSDYYKRSSIDIIREDDANERRSSTVENRTTPEEIPYTFDKLSDWGSISPPINENDITVSYC